MTKGIHHITAIASDAAATVHFYTHILGLRLVKKTVNQDDTATYHLFFGDKVGHPGMDLTFFIFLPARPGQNGSGLVTKISLAVPEESLDFWRKRLTKFKVQHEDITTEFGRQRLLFLDQDGQRLELVGIKPTEIQPTEVWVSKEISADQVIQSFYSATLSVVSLDTVEPILTHVFGYQHVHTEGHVHQYKLAESQRAHYLEVSEEPAVAPGINAAGTVHHIAFRATDAKHQQTLRDKVLELGLYPTEVINRFYFKSVYFRTPAGILFEIATDGPGFTVDEKVEDLGKKLDLPPFLESQRAQIEQHLPPIKGS